MIYEIKDLSFSYNKTKKILDKVALTINEGDLLCVLGRNGAGKSTFFSCLLGLQKDYEGSILLDGKELKNLREKDIALLSGFVPQNHAAVPGISVFDFVMMGCAPKIGLFSHPGKAEEEATYKALETVGISEFAGRMYAELSGGERQQVTIARAIVANPKVVLFDEPTAHLDYSHQMGVLRMIKDLSGKGYAVAVTTHDPNHAILLDGKVALFDGKGHISCGSTDELVTEERLQGICGPDLKIRYLDEFGRRVCIYPSLE